MWLAAGLVAYVAIWVILLKMGWEQFKKGW